MLVRKQRWLGILWFQGPLRLKRRFKVIESPHARKD